MINRPPDGDTTRARRKFSIWRRLRRSRSGTGAIEFALVAPVFFALLFSVFEAGLLFTRISLLDHAVASLSKTVYIGTVTAGLNDGTLTEEDIKQDVCNAVGSVIPSCLANITVEMTQISSVSSMPTTNATCRDSAMDLNPVVEFDPGGNSSIIFLRVCVVVDLITPGMGLAMSLPQLGTGRYELISATAFMNEPF